MSHSRHSRLLKAAHRTEGSSPQLRDTSLVRLVVFADDWGRSPSSCQHLIQQLLPKYDVLWVNTIGTRPFRCSSEDLRRALEKASQWIRCTDATPAATSGLRVVNPIMFPGFRTSWQRSLNARQITNAVHRVLGRPTGERRVAITTIPVTADTVGCLDVDAWVYYCVDDFSVWPGLDGKAMDDMERKMVPKMDRVIAVSETLATRVAAMQAEPILLTHGIDPDHWCRIEHQQYQPRWVPTRWWTELEGPRIVSWGVVDRRLDPHWCRAIADSCGTLIMFGPLQDVDEGILNHPKIVLPGPVEYECLPDIAQHADVLVMPYADLPVTRAIQPLKFKEYLATGKPVVCRNLPAIGDWSDAADLVRSSEELIRLVRLRAEQGTPPEHQQARERLKDESWAAKAKTFEETILSAVGLPIDLSS